MKEEELLPSLQIGGGGRVGARGVCECMRGRREGFDLPTDSEKTKTTKAC